MIVFSIYSIYRYVSIGSYLLADNCLVTDGLGGILFTIYSYGNNTNTVTHCLPWFCHSRCLNNIHLCVNQMNIYDVTS